MVAGLDSLPAMRLRFPHLLQFLAVVALVIGLGWVGLLRQQRDLARLETRALEAENRALHQQLEAERILATAASRAAAPTPHP